MRGGLRQGEGRRSCSPEVFKHHYPSEISSSVTKYEPVFIFHVDISVCILVSFFCSEEMLNFLCPLSTFITFPPMILPFLKIGFVLLMVFLPLLCDPYYVCGQNSFLLDSLKFIFISEIILSFSSIS